MNEEIERSLKVIKEVCSVFSGNLSQHQEIQKSLGVIQKGLYEKGPELVPEDDSDE